MFDRDSLILSIEIPVPSEIRRFCSVTGIDLATYLSQLLTMGCINYMQSNHAILLNFYNSNPQTFISLFNEKE